MGSPTNNLHHNNMHFIDIPPSFITKLTTVEIALIFTHRCNHECPCTVLWNACFKRSLHKFTARNEKLQLRYLPEEVGILILKRKGLNQEYKKYTVDRQTVQAALHGLCYGLPIGGVENQVGNYQKYEGPDHINKPLNGKYFRYLPNQYYKDVNIVEKPISKFTRNTPTATWSENNVHTGYHDRK